MTTHSFVGEITKSPSHGTRVQLEGSVYPGSRHFGSALDSSTLPISVPLFSCIGHIFSEPQDRACADAEVVLVVVGVVVDGG